jgi:hypothetical protein
LEKFGNGFEVMANRIKRGLLTKDVAQNMIDRIFRGNAIDVYKLEEKLERKFK